ncbi:MAG: hypothetical protein IPG10_09950 [Flavobacteriales bacterium]|nr:hypothetical protein [Flavobacteriales bacterium]
MNVTCIRAGVKDLSSGDLIAKAMHIEEKMGNNPYFPNPTPSLATITAARIALDAGVAEALGGAHRAVALRWVYHAELERLLVQLSST